MIFPPERVSIASLTSVPLGPRIDPADEAEVNLADDLGVGGCRLEQRAGAQLDDIAALFVFLSSEDSSYITGGTHNINGGSYIA